MNARYTVALILSCSVFGVAMAAAPQGPVAKAAVDAVSAQRVSHPKPTNLKVLPKDISGDDIDKLMHRYKQDLGVPCGYCHEENAQTKQIDFASDENPVKETARFMIKMNNDINTKYLAQLGDRRYADPFTCGNCHQGQVDPPTFEPKQ
jgi:Photosynthetic reaction centre cytochrome C subunit